ncbi:MAG: helix-turn-helix domain-containing protein [Mariprofundaceae bacterium]
MSEVEKDTAKQPPKNREELLLYVGELLQNARNQKQASLSHISSQLRLPKQHLEDLERGDWSNLPGEVYALGFFRQYAQYLQLDIEQYIVQLKSGHYELTKPLTFPDPPVAPAKKWIILAGLTFVILLVVFNIVDHEVAPLPSQLMQQHETKQSTPSVIVQETETIPANAEKLDLSPVSESPIEVINKPKTTTLTKEKKPTKIIHSYLLKAIKSNVWLQLHKPGNPPKLIREALLKQGQSMLVRQQHGLLLSTGNAPALEIYIDKKLIVKVGELGSSKNKVLHGYRLTLGANQ